MDFFSCKVPGLIFKIVRELRITLDRRMAEYGLTFPQASILIRCVNNPGESLNKLMPHMGTDNAGITRLVDRLEAIELVRRTDGVDRRSISLEPTQKGIELCPKLEALMHTINQELVEGFSEQEITVMADLLNKLFANAIALKNGK